MVGDVVRWVLLGGLKAGVSSSAFVLGIVVIGRMLGLNPILFRDPAQAIVPLGFIAGYCTVIGAAGAALTGGRVLATLSGIAWGVLAVVLVHGALRSRGPMPFVHERFIVIGLPLIGAAIATSLEARRRPCFSWNGLVAALTLVVGVVAAAALAFRVERSDAAVETPNEPARQLRAAPSFLLADLAGKAVRLSDFHGQVVLLNFWATWCAPCLHEMPHLQRLHDEYGKQRLAVIAVSTDRDSETARRFIEGARYTFRVVMADRDIQRDYGVYGLPFTVLIDRSGKLRFRHAGYSPSTIADVESELQSLLRE
jgi:peroxiredoxin